LTSFKQYVWFSFVGAVAATVHCLPDRRCRPDATSVPLTPAGVVVGAAAAHQPRVGEASESLYGRRLA
jgi:hypothetical protein